MRTRRLIILVAAFTLLATACGGGGSDEPSGAVAVGDDTSSGAEPAADDTSSGAEPASPSPETATTSTDLPDVEVVDVNTGETLNLQSLAPSDTPTLLWFWAPH